MTDWSVQDTVENIKNYGYCVVHDAFGQAELAEFIKSYEAVFKLEQPEAHIVKLDNGHMYNVHHKTLRKLDGFTAFFDLFDSEKPVAVAHKYMNCFFDYPVDKVNEMFEVEHNFRNGGTNGSPLHFDMVPSLKTFIYLDHITQGNGAVRVLPGSHVKCREFALQQLLIDPNPLHSDSFLCDVERYSEYHVEGGPGTLIFLDTYCIHGGGLVNNNLPRRSVRAVSWARPLNRNYFENAAFELIPADAAYQSMAFYNPDPVNAELPEHDQGSMYRTLR